MICIYHSRDLDGWMSAAIVKLKFPDVKLIGWDYGQSIPQILVSEPYHAVIMCDVSFSREEMMTIYELNSNHNMIWIDHHASAIKEMGDHPIMGLTNSQYAACELTWMYLFPDNPMPEIVRLLGRYDCFGHKGTDEELYVLKFQYGARQKITNPDQAYACITSSKIDQLVFDIYMNGSAVYDYLCVDARQKYTQRFIFDFDGYKFACVNADRLNPINFGIDYHRDGYDGFACFWYNNGMWNFSLYNDDGLVDCSEICKKRGGGGHKGASGFRIGNINEIILHAIQSQEI